MSKPTLLFIGTGYVSGSVLTRLLREDTYEISATSRQPAHLEKLKSLGVKGIKASLDDTDIIYEAVLKSDIVINGASSDHPGSVDATLKGIEDRSVKGHKTIYIHTSGTGVLDDQAAGQPKDAVTFSDETPDQIEALDDGQPHRLIDKRIARVAEKLKSTAQIYVIIPPLIYGEGDGPFNRGSMQTPSLIKAQIKNGFAGVWGTGAPVWSHIHVRDLADGYVVLLHALEQHKISPKSPYDIYVFAENGQHSWKQLSQEVGERLKARGLLKSAELKPFTDSQIREGGLLIPKEKFGIPRDYQSTGCNSISKAVKLRQLGWSPQQPHLLSDVLDYDIDQVVAEVKA